MGLSFNKIIMPLPHYAEFFVWAESQVLEKAKELPDEKFQEKIQGVDRSPKDLISHLVATYDYYFLPQTTQAYKDVTAEVNNLGKDDLLIRWEKSVKKFADAMINNEKDEFEIPVGKDKTSKVPALDWFLLYTDHASYHRGQLMSFIKINGGESANTDYFTYYYQTKLS